MLKSAITANAGRLLGVIDIQHGLAVRAVGGRRAEYRPISSRLCDSADPLRVAAAYREQFSINRLYIADLDALTGRGENSAMVAALVAEGFDIAVDMAAATPDAVACAFDLGVQTVIVALETLPGRDALAALGASAKSQLLAFSLDLQAGQPLADARRWGQPTWTADAPRQLAAQAVNTGFRTLVVLDLHAVGTAAGPATVPLCRQLSADFPGVQLWTGGGVRTAADVQLLVSAGAEGVLVATALHDQTLQIERIC